MLPFHLTVWLASIAMSISISAALGAQRSRDARVAAVSKLEPDAPSANMPLDLSPPRNVVLAGVLSFVVPGVGSFYAGRPRHGLVHLGVAGLSFATALLGTGIAIAVTEESNNSSDFRTGVTLASFGATVYLVNDVWSIFTAVHDARGHRSTAAGR